MKDVKIAMSANRRMDIVDYLKGFSIFTIALMHLIQMIPNVPSILRKLSSIGGTGVHVFFLCSGFGLYLSYLHKKTNYIEFIKKRFMKIYIPYIIVILISFFVPWMYSANDRISAILSHIFLYKMFIPRFEESFGIHFWFISTIIQFYIVFIPMCNVKEKLNKNSTFMMLFMLISVGWWILCYILGVTDERVWSSFFLQYIWEFSLGMVLADVFNNGRKVELNTAILLLMALVGIALQAFMATKSEVLKIFNDIPALIGYTSLALLLMLIPMIKRCAKWLSIISYEYYLVHILVFTTVMHFMPQNSLFGQVIVGLICLILGIIFAFDYHKFIKKINKCISL